MPHVFSQATKVVKQITSETMSTIRTTGCVLALDGWTDTANRPLINVLRVSPAGAEFLYAVDTTGEVRLTSSFSHTQFY
jgi:hypothetical protein